MQKRISAGGGQMQMGIAAALKQQKREMSSQPTLIGANKKPGLTKMIQGSTQNLHIKRGAGDLSQVRDSTPIGLSNVKSSGNLHLTNQLEDK